MTYMLSDLNRRYLSFGVLLILFILCPFLSLPFIFREIYNGKKYPMLLLAVFMGLLSMFYFPWGDQYSYYNDLEDCRFLSFEEKFDFSSVMIIRELNLINIIIFFSSKIGFSLEFLRFLLTFIGTSLIFSIFVDLDRDKKLPFNRKYKFLLFVMLWLSVPYYLIAYGFRTGLGACILTYGVYQIFIKNHLISGGICLLIASSIHYLFIILSLIFYIILFSKSHLSLKKTLLSSIVFYIVSLGLFNILYGHIPFVDMIMDFYIFGDKYGAGSYDWLSPASKELWINGVLNVAVLFIVIFRLNNKGKIENVIYILFILCVMCLTYATIFQRMVRSIVPLLTLYLVIHNKSKIVYNSRYIVTFVLSCSFIYPYILHREKYAYGHIERIIYYPLPMLLENHYDETTINIKVYSDGSYRP